LLGPACSLALSLPASAQGFSIGHASGAASGAHIVYHIETCGLKHIRLGVGLLVESQEDARGAYLNGTKAPVAEYRFGPYRQRYYCSEWTLSIADIWPRSEWVVSQLFAFDYNHRKQKHTAPFEVVLEPLPEVSPREPYDREDYPVTCADGWVSPSGGDQGACSHHGGVG
jgi:hypothetical protein